MNDNIASYRARLVNFIRDESLSESDFDKLWVSVKFLIKILIRHKMFVQASNLLGEHSTAVTNRFRKKILDE